VNSKYKTSSTGKIERTHFGGSRTTSWTADAAAAADLQRIPLGGCKVAGGRPARGQPARGGGEQQVRAVPGAE